MAFTPRNKFTQEFIHLYFNQLFNSNSMRHNGQVFNI